MRLRARGPLVSVAAIGCLTVGCTGQASAEDVPLGRESTGSAQVGDPAEGFASLRESRRVIVTTMRSAAASLATDDEKVQSAIGGAATCGSAPTAAAEYGAYARLVGGLGSPEARLREAAQRMVAAGWEIEARRGEPDPAYRLAKGPAAAVGLGLEDRDDGTSVRFAVQGPCLRIEGPGLAEFADEELDLR